MIAYVCSYPRGSGKSGRVGTITAIVDIFHIYGQSAYEPRYLGKWPEFPQNRDTSYI
jgi:hypothetical protein